MPWCEPCDRFFETSRSYDQHVQNSAAHRYQYESSSEEEQSWECAWCDRSFASERSCHQHMGSAAGHPYCIDCKRMFKNEHNLVQHRRSKIHAGQNMACPFCKGQYTTASGITIHLESGVCTSGLDRQQINDIVRRWDRKNVITIPMIELPGYQRVDMWATDAAYNGYGYECYLCHRVFASLPGLNNHLKSPTHEQNIYRCPNRSCGKTFKALSGLVQHVESENCGVMKFTQVQNAAKNGLQNMVGKLITR